MNISKKSASDFLSGLTFTMTLYLIPAFLSYILASFVIGRNINHPELQSLGLFFLVVIPSTYLVAVILDRKRNVESFISFYKEEYRNYCANSDFITTGLIVSTFALLYFINLIQITDFAYLSSFFILMTITEQLVSWNKEKRSLAREFTSKLP